MVRGGLTAMRYFPALTGALLLYVWLTSGGLLAWDMEGQRKDDALVPDVDVADFGMVPSLHGTRAVMGFTLADCEADENSVRIRRVKFCKIASSETLPAQIGPAIRYRVLVEKGLESGAFEFAGDVARILAAEDGWVLGGMQFVHVNEDFDLTIVLAQPRAVDRLCRPLRTRGRLSCAISGRAVINAKRWRDGADTWGDNVARYRHYLVNHEVGHLLGLSHARCPGPGMPAPIMLPQTKYLKKCAANGALTETDLAMLDPLKSLLAQRLSRISADRLRPRPRIRRAGRRRTYARSSLRRRRWR